MPVSVQRDTVPSISYSVSKGAKDHVTALLPFTVCATQRHEPVRCGGHVQARRRPRSALPRTQAAVKGGRAPCKVPVTTGRDEEDLGPVCTQRLVQETVTQLLQGLARDHAFWVDGEGGEDGSAR